MGDDYQIYDDTQPQAAPLGPPQQSQFQPPTDPYTAADGIELSRLENGRSVVEQRRAAGLYDEETSADLMRQIDQRRMPLMRRKEASQSADVAKQVQMAYHQNAQVQGMQAQDAQFHGANFDKTVGRVTDADGNERLFVPKGWEEVQPKDTVEAAGLAENPEQQSELKANPDGTHTLTIYNGANRSDTQFQFDPQSNGWKTVGRQEFDANGQPVQAKPSQAEGNPDGTLSHAQRVDIHAKARQLLGNPPPEIDRFGRANPLRVEYEKRLDGEVRRMEDEQTRINATKLKSGLSAENTQARQAETAKLAEQKARATTYNHNHDSLLKQFDKFESEQTPAAMRPEWARDYDSMLKEAERRTDSQMKSKYHREANGLPGDEATTPTKTPAGAAPDASGQIENLGEQLQAYYKQNKGTLFDSNDPSMVGKMASVLQAPHAEKRPMTDAEKAQYESYRNKIKDPALKAQTALGGSTAMQPRGLPGQPASPTVIKSAQDAASKLGYGPSDAAVSAGPKAAVSPSAPSGGAELAEVNRLGNIAQKAFNESRVDPIGSFENRVAGRLGFGSNSLVKDALNELASASKQGRGLTQEERDRYLNAIEKLAKVNPSLAAQLKLEVK